MLGAKIFADCQFLKCSFGGFCGIACHLCDNEQSIPYLLGMLIQFVRNLQKKKKLSSQEILMFPQ